MGSATVSTAVGYYDQPMLKRPVWSADIPLYYFVGGAAGAALTLGAACQLLCDKEFRQLSTRCHWIGIAGCTIGAALLIHDLGRPERFAFMLRVFRPTSPMNIGAWILAGAAPTAFASRLPGRIGEISGYASGIFGAALAGYTGVLVANTVQPAWRDSGRWMPPLFIASGAAAAASILEILYPHGAAARVTRIFGTAGRAAELLAAQKVSKTSFLWKAAGALTAASLVISLLPGKSKSRKRIAGVLGAAGSLCLRFAVHREGR